MSRVADARLAGWTAAALLVGAGLVGLANSIAPDDLGAAGVHTNLLRVCSIISVASAVVVWQMSSRGFSLRARVVVALWGTLLLELTATTGQYAVTSQAAVVLPVFMMMVLAWLGLTSPRGVSAAFAPLLVAASVLAAMAVPGSQVGVAASILVIAIATVVAETVAWAMSQVRSRESELAEQATVDPLTGLLNRRAFASRLDECVQARERVLLAFVDLNGFKDVNDTFGHHVGDEILVEVAQRLRRVTRADDVVGRFGGDEFVILFRTPNPSVNTDMLVERIRGVLAGAWPLIAPWTVTASVGVVDDRDGSRSPDDLLREADAAMFARKHGTEVSSSPETMTSRSLAHYRRAMDGLTGAFSVLRRVATDDVVDWQMVEANSLLVSRYEAVCGNPVGKLLSDLEQYADQSQLRPVFDRALDKRAAQEHETLLSLPDGTEGWRRVLVVPVDDDAVAVMTFDITAERTAAEALRYSEQRSRAIVETAGDAILTVDDDDVICSFNRTAEAMFGVSRHDVLGRPYHMLVPSVSRTVLANAVSDDGRRTEVVLSRGRGDRFIAEVGISSIETGDGTLYTASIRDVSEQRRAEAAAEEAQSAFQHAFDDAPIGMALIDPDGSIRSVNREYATLLGRDRDELAGMSVLELTHPDDRATGRRLMEQLFAGEIERFACEKRYLRPDGRTVWASLHVALVRDQDGRPSYSIGQIEDITMAKTLQLRLDYEATHDELTQLLNRAGLVKTIAAALDESRLRDDRVGILFVDLDHFKRINDAYGRSRGDEAIATVAQRLSSQLRPSDTVAHVGGDEFVVLCREVDHPKAAIAVARRLLKCLADPIDVGGREVFVTASIGIALSNAENDTPETLLRNADAAMYRAKSRGRACFATYDTRAAGSPAEILKIESELRRALQRRELLLYYQPIVDLDTGLVIGFEALLRWQHPERGLVPPNDFIGIAEESGLIVPMGDWVLETACRQLVAWDAPRDRGRSPLTVHVNLSARQLDDPALANRIGRIMDRTGIDASALCLEITEHSLVRDGDQATRTLDTLRAKGVRLSIDDFGTGYSSLSLLKRFPVESLKIDRSFVAGLGVRDDDSSIVQAVITLAHALGLTAVAEGLETPDQLKALRTLGCDFAQGYLLGRPLPPEQAGRLPADDLTAWHAEPGR